MEMLANYVGLGIVLLLIPSLFIYKYFERKWAREGKVLGYQSGAVGAGVNVFKAAYEADSIKKSGGVVPTNPGIPFVGAFLMLTGFALAFGTDAAIYIGTGLMMIGVAFIYAYFLPAHLRKTQFATGIMLGLMVGGIVMALTDVIPGLAAGKGWAGIAVFAILLVAGFFSRKNPQ